MLSVDFTIPQGRLYDLRKSRGVSISVSETQIDYLYQELSASYPSVLSTLKSAKFVKEASDVVLKKFEMPIDFGTAVQNTRASYGQRYYDKHAKANNSTSSSTLKPTIKKTKPATVIKVAVYYGENGSSAIIRAVLGSKHNNFGFNSSRKTANFPKMQICGRIKIARNTHSGIYKKTD